MMEINKHLFICGMSRGGTTWLGNCLNEHPNVAVFGESLYWGRNYKEPAKDGYSESQVSEVLSLLSMGTTAFLGDGLGNLKHVQKSKWREVKYLKVPSPCAPGTLYSNICGWVASEEEVDYVIEKTPHHIDWIPRIKKSLPDAKFVMMVRDPYSFMLSYKHQGDRKSPTTKRKFDKLYHPMGCAFIWRRYMMSTLSAEANYSGSVLRVEFQLLRNEPTRVWNDVLRFFGLPDAPLVSVDEQNSSFPQERPKLESIDVFWMNLIAGRVMRNANYDLAGSCVRGMDVLKSFCLLIPWGVFAAQHLRQKVSGGVLKYLKFIKW